MLCIVCVCLYMYLCLCGVLSVCIVHAVCMSSGCAVFVCLCWNCFLFVESEWSHMSFIIWMLGTGCIMQTHPLSHTRGGHLQESNQDSKGLPPTPGQASGPCLHSGPSMQSSVCLVRMERRHTEVWVALTASWAERDPCILTESFRLFLKRLSTSLIIILLTNSCKNSWGLTRVHLL